jgi:hypothetical protein
LQQLSIPVNGPLSVASTINVPDTGNDMIRACKAVNRVTGDIFLGNVDTVLDLAQVDDAFIGSAIVTAAILHAGLVEGCTPPGHCQLNGLGSIIRLS